MLSFDSVPGSRLCLAKGVHSADDVRGELVAIFAAVAADVTLEGVSVAVATHVDGVHDVIQKKHAAVLTLEHPHLVSFGAEHSDPVSDALLMGALVRSRQRRPDAGAGLIYQFVSWAAASRIGRIVAAVAGRALAPIVHLALRRLAGLRPCQCDGTVGAGGIFRLVGWMVGQMERLVVARALQAWAERIHRVEQGVHHGHDLRHGQRRVRHHGTQRIAV